MVLWILSSIPSTKKLRNFCLLHAPQHPREKTHNFSGNGHGASELCLKLLISTSALRLRCQLHIASTGELPPDVRRNSAFEPNHVIWRHGQQCLDIDKGGTVHEFSKEPSYGVCVDFRGVACSLKLCWKDNDGNWVFSIKHLAFHLDGSLFPYLLHFICPVVIISLNFVNETVRAIANGCMVCFTHWYQKFKAVIGMISLVHLGCWEAAITTASMTVAPFLFERVLIMAGIRLIQRHNVL